MSNSILEIYKDAEKHYLNKDFIGTLDLLKDIIFSNRYKNNFFHKAFDLYSFLHTKNIGIEQEEKKIILQKLLCTYEYLENKPYSFFIYKSIIYLYNDDMDNFFNNLLMQKKYMLYNSEYMGGHLRGLNSIIEDEYWYKNTKTNKILENIEYIDYEDFGGEFVILFASDSVYFKKFYKFPLGSIKNNFILHFHIVDPDNDTIELAKKIKNENNNVNISFEKSSSTLKNKVNFKSYYACSRFLIARRILTKYKKDLFIFDIDILFLKNLNNLFVDEGWDRKKMGIRYTKDLVMPWMKMTANAIYFPCSELSNRYLSRMETYIAYQFKENNKKDIWWIDQNALYFTFLSLRNEMIGNYQVWGHRLSYLKFPELFSDKQLSLLKKYGNK